MERVKRVYRSSCNHSGRSNGFSFVCVAFSFAYRASRSGPVVVVVAVAAVGVVVVVAVGSRSDTTESRTMTDGTDEQQSGETSSTRSLMRLIARQCGHSYITAGSDCVALGNDAAAVLCWSTQEETSAWGASTADCSNPPWS